MNKKFLSENLKDGDYMSDVNIRISDVTIEMNLE
jgi:hypothetical protein